MPQKQPLPPELAEFFRDRLQAITHQGKRILISIDKQAQNWGQDGVSKPEAL